MPKRFIRKSGCRAAIRRIGRPILTEISESLVNDGVVKISFGTFSVRQKGRRVGRNPKTGQEVPIMPRRVLVFRASQVLKDRINGIAGASNAEDD